MPLASHQATTPCAAASPKALPPVSSTAETPCMCDWGWRTSVSLVPGPPPRTLTEATLPAGGITTVQPVIPTGSVQWPTARSSRPRLTAGSPPCSRARRAAHGATATQAADGTAAPARRGEGLAGQDGELRVEHLVLLEEGEVAGVLQHQQAGAGDPLGHVARAGRRGEAVGVADRDQGRQVERLQHVGEVEVDQAGEDLGPDLDVGAREHAVDEGDLAERKVGAEAEQARAEVAKVAAAAPQLRGPHRILPKKLEDQLDGGALHG